MTKTKNLTQNLDDQQEENRRWQYHHNDNNTLEYCNYYLFYISCPRRTGFQPLLRILYQSA